VIVEGDNQTFLKKNQKDITLALNLRVGHGPLGPPSRSASSACHRAPLIMGQFSRAQKVASGAVFARASTNTSKREVLLLA
jgi:hypothetical protein